MPSVLELTDRLDRLRKARAAGVQEVRTADGRTVTYKDDGQMAAAAHDLERQITVASGVPITDIRIAASKGLE